MRLDHPDYIKLVLGTYNRMRANSELSLSLVQSTPGSIKQECVNVYQERYEKRDEQRFRKDEPAVRAFFGQAEHGRRLLAVIQDFDVNKFKPLDKYLKSAGTTGINKRNLELFAWLIDFKHRPYSFGMEVILDEEEEAIINNPGGNPSPPVEKVSSEETKDNAPGTIDMSAHLQVEIDDSPVINKATPEIYGAPVPNNNTGRKKPKRIIAFILVLVSLLAGGYIWKKGGELIDGSTTGCMYWADDHFEKVSCNEEEKKRHFIPLDEERRRNFQRITKVDTISEKSIGVLYYISINGIKEYYTAGGNHPVYITRPLRVLTRYVFENNLVKKDMPGKDSLAEQNVKLITNR